MQRLRWRGVLGAAAGLVMAVALGGVATAAEALSCDITQPLDTVWAEADESDASHVWDIEGVLEVEVIAVSSIPVIRDARIWVVPVRAWGSVPDELLRLHTDGGDWTLKPLEGYGWWTCTRTPRLGEHMFSTHGSITFEDGAHAVSMPAYEPEDASLLSADGPVASRLGPPTMFSTSPLTIARAWVEAWWLPGLAVAALLVLLLRRRRRRRSAPPIREERSGVPGDEASMGV